MKRSYPCLLLLGTWALGACGASINPARDGSAESGAADALVLPDGALVSPDAVVVLPDGALIGPDAVVGPDAGAEGGGPPDGEPPFDAGPPMDLVGSWRAVHLHVASTERTPPYEFGTSNTPTSFPSGLTLDGRTLGLMQVSANRIAQAAGLYYNDRAWSDSSAMAAYGSLSVWGFGGSGTAIPGAFMIGTTRLGFDSNADGTITERYDSGTAVTWQRVMLPAGAAALMVDGQATAFQPTGSGSMPLSNLRVALAWDLAAGGYTYVSEQPLSFGPLRNASYRFSAAGMPPPTAQGNYGGTLAALAYVLVYDDVDHSGTYGGASSTDRVRGLSNVALAWRQGGDTAALTATPLRHLLQGYQVVVLAPDYSTGRSLPVPLDPAGQPSADIAVNFDVETTPLPDLVR